MTKVEVVSYSISTSNHNWEDLNSSAYNVVSYSISTSNHNFQILTFRFVGGCILFHFYIKPQPMAHKVLFSSTLSPKSHSLFQRNAVV